MDRTHEDWELCAIAGATGLFYLTGTICDGVLMISRGGVETLWVHRNYDRSLLESELPDIRKISSYRDIASSMGDNRLPNTLYLDTAHVSMGWYAMLNKYLKFENVISADGALMKMRSVKSAYELERLRIAGGGIDRLMTEALPALVRGGISEAELGADLLALFIKNGHQGISRFAMRNTSELLGHVAFGDGSLYPGVFNGASGIAGLYPALPALGSRERKLRAGDLIFADLCFGVDGYNVDKTLVFSYKGRQSERILEAQGHCVELQNKAASLLRPGAVPSAIYEEIVSSVRPEFKDHFMGAPNRTVPFIGHSVGLFVDETPVVAKGFDEPLMPNMVMALEPKMGFEGVGMVGGENTYLVTEDGAVSLTGKAAEIIDI